MLCIIYLRSKGFQKGLGHNYESATPPSMPLNKRETPKGTFTPGGACRAYCQGDRPGIWRWTEHHERSLHRTGADGHGPQAQGHQGRVRNPGAPQGFSVYEMKME